MTHRRQDRWTAALGALLLLLGALVAPTAAFACGEPHGIAASAQEAGGDCHEPAAAGGLPCGLGGCAHSCCPAAALLPTGYAGLIATATVTDALHTIRPVEAGARPDHPPPRRFLRA